MTALSPLASASVCDVRAACAARDWHAVGFWGPPRCTPEAPDAGVPPVQSELSATPCGFLPRLPNKPRCSFSCPFCLRVGVAATLSCTPRACSATERGPLGVPIGRRCVCAAKGVTAQRSENVPSGLGDLAAGSAPPPRCAANGLPTQEGFQQFPNPRARVRVSPRKPSCRRSRRPEGHAAKSAPHRGVDLAEVPTILRLEILGICTRIPFPTRPAMTLASHSLISKGFIRLETDLVIRPCAGMPLPAQGWVSRRKSTTCDFVRGYSIYRAPRYGLNRARC